ncbi:BTAD domain-containing putative transcriptional regulator [Pseudonocardia sp. WMMC193]|uniref:BTAD domain-containing putative transcriptional regulator n=1 Tax=Pseudonocardia sp. WMMC193 TaxID=2911965 RepID=UPI001F1FBF6B|nr:BTAD domain-containing putative transcriptional regulator [Pseudonocardia sp. WMMC193]MCF7552377.1 AAA family ATPase [Pseudonocardia sp. WMMC193]
MRFAVLGPLQASRDGRAVELGPARRRVVLAALLVDVGRIVSVDTLVDRVWDGRAPGNPLPTVHAYLSRLRAALRPDDVLATAAPGYRLDVDPGSVDAVAFERAVIAADQAFLAGDLAAAQRSAQAATQLWKGEPYADVVSEFARVEATRLHGLRSRVEEVGIQVDLAQGRHALLVERLRARVAAEPLRESLQGALMLALYRSDRHADALAVYRRLRAALAEELGTDPSRALQTLHEQMLRQDPALDHTAAPVAAPAQAPAPIRAAGPSAPRMVGRAAELGRVREVVERAWSSPQTTVAALVGEPGIGKTRLLDELASTAEPDVVVAWGRSWEHEGSPPLWPWVQVLRDVVAAVGAETAAAAARGRGAAVLALDPDLVAGPEPPRVPQGSLEVHLFDGILAFLAELAGTHRLLVLLEDLHWADAASRRFVEYLVTHGAQPGLAVVLTLRSVADDGGPKGSELLAALARGGRTTRVDLPGLGPEAVRDYVADRTGTTLDDATADALVERTGGNPFFVGEIVSLLDTDGEPSTDVPESVRGVILRRVQRLSTDDQTVLRTAAVVGRTFDLDLLREASGLDEAVVDEAVDRATATGMLASEPGAPGRHRFFHALMQQTLLEDIGPARRRRLHGRIAAALSARSGTDADHLVHHLASAGGEEDIVRAGEVCVAASDAAHRRGSYSASEALLLKAIELASRLPPERGDRVEMVARTRLAALYTLSYHANFPGYSAMRQRMTELVRRLGSNLDLLAGLQGEYSAGLFNCDFVSAAAAGEEMVARGAADDDPLMSLGGHYARGMIALFTGRPDDAVDSLGVADGFVEHVGSMPVNLLTVPVEGIRPWRLVAFALAGRWDEAGELRAAVAPLRASSDPAVLANVEGELATAYSVLDDVEAAVLHGEAAVAVAEDAGLGPVLMYLRITLAWAHARRGTGPIDAVREAIAALPDQPTMLMRPYHLGLLADVLLHAHAPEAATEAEELLTRALSESAASGDVFWDSALHRLRAAARERLGRPASEVAAERARAVEVARAQNARALLQRALRPA